MALTMYSHQAFKFTCYRVLIITRTKSAEVGSNPLSGFGQFNPTKYVGGPNAL